MRWAFLHNQRTAFTGLVLFFLLSSHIDLFGQNNLSPTTAGKQNVFSITEFKVFNDDLPLDSILKLKTISLSSDHSSFSIGFKVKDNISSNEEIFYKLEGADNNWIRTNRTAIINYTLLPPGKYSFKLKYAQDGRILEKTALEIMIKLPFYLSWWFILVFCAVIIGGAYFLHYLSIKRLIAVEAVRQKVSRDLHDDIGSTLSTINILSMMARSKMMEDPVKASEFMSKISDNSSRMLEAMDDIVWSINPMNDSMQKIFARMREFANQVLESKDIDVAFHFDEETYHISLNMEQRRDVFLIFKEAVNNIAKYAHATTVNIDVTLKAHKLCIVIKDNGSGFDVNTADSGNGLNNMQKRAEKLKANFKISSKKDAGTIISFEMRTT
jgi:two-component sensor histidine kinase